MKKKKSTKVDREEMMGYFVYTLVKLGYPRSQVKRVLDELSMLFHHPCAKQVYLENIRAGKMARKKLLPTDGKKG